VVLLDILDEVGVLAATGVPEGTFHAASLDRFLSLGPQVWKSVRDRLGELLTTGHRHERAVRIAFRRIDEVTCLLPFTVADYVDFYSSIHHATNLGKLLRPGSEPLLPNWRHLPVGYHGRSGTVAVSGTPVRRPCGLVAGIDAGEPLYSPSARLDIELELGTVVGVGSTPGRPVAPDEADRHVFGFVLLNDWSARDIQAYEYQPLGPFLGKSFATTISPWVVTLDALAPFLVQPPEQEPPVAAYLRATRPWGLDLDLSIELDGAIVSRASFADMYWTFAQQVAHTTGNGATLRTGDLLGSGTVSGPEPGSYGSLIELTWGGRDPLVVGDGSTRTFLRDGDEVVLRGHAGTGGDRVGFGECRGTIAPA
jgi:fumarylacetoacetase